MVEWEGGGESNQKRLDSPRLYAVRTNAVDTLATPTRERGGTREVVDIYAVGPRRDRPRPGGLARGPPLLPRPFTRKSALFRPLSAHGYKIKSRGKRRALRPRAKPPGLTAPTPPGFRVLILRPQGAPRAASSSAPPAALCSSHAPCTPCRKCPGQSSPAFRTPR